MAPPWGGACLESPSFTWFPWELGKDHYSEKAGQKLGPPRAGQFQDLFHPLPGSHGKTGRIRVEGRWARSQWRLPESAISRNSFLYLVPMERRGGSGSRGGRPEAGGPSLERAILRNSIFYLVPMRRRGGSGLRGIMQEAGGASLGWAIARNSIYYLVPMGRRGGSGLRGGGPEASGASLGWAISRNSTFYLVPMGSREKYD